MRVRGFRTSGTTGKPKEFTLSADLQARRVERLAWTKGAEFNALRSIVWLNARLSAGHEKIRTWCEARGVALHYEPRPADGVIGSPFRLVELANSGRFQYGYVLSGGAPLSPQDCRTIRDGLCAPAGAMYATYGLSECGTVALATPAQIEMIAGCVGRVFDDVSAETVDGHLRVKTPTMADELSRDGWVWTSDRAEFVDDGLLVLKGRMV